MLKVDHVKKLRFDGLSARRREVFPGGVALLSAAFFLFEEEQRRSSRVVTGNQTGSHGPQMSAWQKNMPPRGTRGW